MDATITKDVWDKSCYPVSLCQMPEEEGGYWLAGIPLLGEGLFIADGETPQEALDALEERRRRMYDIVVRSGRPVPLPSPNEETTQLRGGTKRDIQQ